MKKILLLLCIPLILFGFGACARTEKATTKPNTTMQATTDPATTQAAGSEAIDLTVLSGTAVYSQVYNMLITPADYMGKTVKMQGQFNRYQDPDTKKVYTSVIIADATACCQQGLEFQAGNAADRLKNGSTVTVEGTFDTYQEGELTYCYLKDAQILS